MTGLETIGLIAGLAGTGLSAVGAIAEGQQQNAAMKAQAVASERQANEERAASQREAIQRSREAKLVLSRQQALAGNSGGGASDPSIVGLMGDVAAAGGFNTASAIFEGESRGRGLEDQAAISRWQGKQARTAGLVKAGTTVLSGISGFADGWTTMKRRQAPSPAGMPNFWNPAGGL